MSASLKIAAARQARAEEFVKVTKSDIMQVMPAVLKNTAETRAFAAPMVKNIVNKVLAGHFQQDATAAVLVLRYAIGLADARFAPLFETFTGSAVDVEGLEAILADPYASLAVAKAEKLAALLAATGDVSYAKKATDKAFGTDAAIEKARTAKNAETVQRNCNAFIRTYLLGE
jgi:hypothetical protein